MRGTRAGLGDDRGFTLIELMVVVLIIGILAAIAIPSFLGAQNSAKDTAAKATLKNALTTAKVYQADHGGSYVDFDPEAGAALEPSLPWVNPTPNGSTIGVAATATTVTLTLVSESGNTCTLTQDDVTGASKLECGTAAPAP